MEQIGRLLCGGGSWFIKCAGKDTREKGKELERSCQMVLYIFECGHFMAFV